MSAKTIRIKTFNPTADSFGLNGPDFVGNIRKGELRGIIKSIKTCAKPAILAARSARSMLFRVILAPSTRLTISAV